MNPVPQCLLHARICPACQDAVALRTKVFPLCKLTEWTCVSDRRHVVYEAIIPVEKAA